MKFLIALFATLPLSAAALAGDTSGPADKADSGSLSSGAKDASPATRNQGETAPLGEGVDGTSAGESGHQAVPGTKKGMGSSDPKGVEKK